MKFETFFYSWLVVIEVSIATKLNKYVQLMKKIERRQKNKEEIEIGKSNVPFISND